MKANTFHKRLILVTSALQVRLLKKQIEDTRRPPAVPPRIHTPCPARLPQSSATCSTFSHSWLVHANDVTNALLHEPVSVLDDCVSV